MRMMKRLLPALLALLVLTTTAFAAEGSQPFIQEILGDHDVSFTDPQSRDKLNITVNDSAIQRGKEYMIWAVEGESTIPTESNLLYIGQAAAVADGTVTFAAVYPSEMKACTIYVTGQTFAAPQAVCRVALSADEVLRGDIHEDGSINTTDLVALRQHLASLSGCVLTGRDLQAADYYSDGSVNTSDAVALAQHLAGLS